MAEASLSLNQSELKGQKILVYVSKSQADEAEAKDRTVFLTNLPLTATETSIRELTESLLPATAAQGAIEIEEIRLIRDQKGRVKGFAYLQLKDASSVQAAIDALNNAKLHGRTIHAEKTKLKEQILQQTSTNNAIVVTNLSFSVR